jgi:hypothetical protein
MMDQNNRIEGSNFIYSDIHYAHILLIKTLLNLKNIYISKYLHTGKNYANLGSVPIVYELKLVATKKLKTVSSFVRIHKKLFFSER